MLIAIDGTSGSGKSTIASAIAERLHFNHLNTGELYRKITKDCIRSNINFEDTRIIIKTAEICNFEMEYDDLHSEEISKYVPFIAKIDGVREIVRRYQKKAALNQDIVIEGRDIGTVVFPDAKIKIFITASAECRARRRFAQLNSNEHSSFNEILENINNRDYLDEHRIVSPLKPSSNAFILDTTNLSIDESVDRIIEYIELCPTTAST